MSNTSTASNGGIGLAGGTFLVFLACKLTGNINWSWWWVTAPLWGVLALIAALMVIAGICFGIAGIIDYVQRRRRRAQRANAMPKKGTPL